MITTQTGIRNTNLKTLSALADPGKLFSYFKLFFKPFSSLSSKSLLLGVLLLLMALPEMSGQWLPGFGFRKEIPIPDGNIYGSGTHTNFPVLIDIEHDDLRSVSNGGLVVSEDGWDIVFSDADGTTLLNHEIEAYYPDDGRIIAWVQVPELDADNDYTIYVYFTTPFVPAADPSTTDTWDPADYVAVYHLQGTDYFDATENNHVGTPTGTANALGSRIEDGQDFEYDNNTDRVEMPGFDVYGDEITISAWIRPESFAQNDARIVSKAEGDIEPEHWWMLSTKGVSSNTVLRFRVKAGGVTDQLIGDANSNLSLSIGAYTSAVYDGNSMYLYKDAVLSGSKLHSHRGDLSTDNSIDVAIGNQPTYAIANGGPRAFDGTIDEVRIQKVARSQEWLQTEYENQLAPTSFYSSLGTTEIINDDPCDAIELIVDECYSSDFLTNYSATPSTGIDLPGCGDYQGGDVWFKVTVPINEKVVV